MKKHILMGLLVIIVITFGAIGCKNTAHGFGKDVEHTGEKIQDKTE